MKTLLRIFLIILLSVQSINNSVSDFTYYPEDNSIAADFIFTSAETFWGSYYFSDSGVTLKDTRNGVPIVATQDVRKIKS